MRRIPLIWLRQEVLRRVMDEADTCFPDETGGVIAGYRASPDEYVVSAASGPGPLAVHAPTRFSPDHDHHLSWLASHYEASARSETYLGDWHTHPNAARAEPSWTDRRAAAAIASCADARAETPLMMIASGRTGDWRPRAWLFANRTVLGFFSTRRFLKCEIETYN